MERTHEIVLAYDHAEGEEFARWLRSHGHDASVGHDTDNWVDDESTYSEEDARETLDTLWAAYCRS